MGSLTNYAENWILNHQFATAQTAPGTVYLALCTADPGEAATGASMSEVPNAGGYARVAISFGAAASRRVTQSALVSFAQSSAGWGTLTHWAIVDSATYGAGNALAYGEIEPDKIVVTNNTPSVASAAIYVEISAGSLGSMTTYNAHKALDHLFRNQAFTQPATYVGLTTTVSADATPGTEVSGGAYARVLVNKASGASPAWNTPSGDATDNANTITFATPSASWGTVVSSGLWDASTSGNQLWYMNDTPDQAIASGDPVSFPAGSLDVSLA